MAGDRRKKTEIAVRRRSIYNIQNSDLLDLTTAKNDICNFTRVWIFSEAVEKGSGFERILH
jgi:hypothetical protein